MQRSDDRPQRFHQVFPLAFLACLTLGAALARAETRTTSSDWPQFLGPNRNGISPETGLWSTWPAGGPKELWRVPGGVGASGIAVARGRLFTLAQRGGQQWLIALNAETGKTEWQTAIAPEFKNAMGDGPRATPAVSGDSVFVYGGGGTLAALNVADGKPIWSHDPVKELGGEPAEYGMAGSPLIVGDQVIVAVGAPQATLAAYRKTSGELLWKAGDDPAGYSSPTLLTIRDQPQVVLFSGSSLLGLAPRSGELMWRYPYVTDYHCNIATPLVFQDRILISSGENHGSVLLDVKQAPSGPDIVPVWESQGPKSVLRAEWQTPILIEGYLYGFDNVGSAGPVTHLTCVRAASGERVWQQPRFGKGNLIAADGKLWISTLQGELVVVRASPDKYEELGRAEILGATRQAPALADGRLYLRDDQEIVCLDVREK